MSKVVDLTVRVVIADEASEQLLRKFAQKCYSACWGDDWDAKTVSIGECLYEALVARCLYEALVAINGTKQAPLDYGIELIDWDAKESGTYENA